MGKSASVSPRFEEFATDFIFRREYGSAKTMDSLRQLASPSASVVRASEDIVIPANQLVIGDIVQLKTGDVVPADLRLISSTNFETDEALLTGESLPVQKNHSATWNDKSEDSSWSPTDVGVGGEPFFAIRP